MKYVLFSVFGLSTKAQRLFDRLCIKLNFTKKVNSVTVRKMALIVKLEHLVVTSNDIVVTLMEFRSVVR